jgi:hypothetical protein
MTSDAACRSALLGALVAFFPLGAESRLAPVEVNPIVPFLDANRNRVPQGSALECTYTWVVEPGARKLDQDYRAFVHFVDARGRLLFTDDHAPAPPSSRWEVGRTYSYRRTVFVPVVGYGGHVEVRMGLYPYPGGGARPALKGEHRGQHEYKVAALELLPPTEEITVVRGDGWHDPERDPANPASEHTWTKREAAASFENPKRTVVVYLEGSTCAACFSSPPVLTVRIGSRVGLRIPIPGPQPILTKIRVHADDLGAGERVGLRLAMSESFVPARLKPPLNADDRELGFDVHHLCVVTARTVGPAPGIVDAVSLSATPPE